MFKTFQAEDWSDIKESVEQKTKKKNALRIYCRFGINRLKEGKYKRKVTRESAVQNEAENTLETGKKRSPFTC